MFPLQIWFAILKYGKDYFRKSCIKIKISKSCCYMKIMAVIVTIQWSFLTVTNPVIVVNDYWPAFILSTAVLLYLRNCTYDCDFWYTFVKWWYLWQGFSFFQLFFELCSTFFTCVWFFKSLTMLFLNNNRLTE